MDLFMRETTLKDKAKNGNWQVLEKLLKLSMIWKTIINGKDYQKSITGIIKAVIITMHWCINSSLHHYWEYAENLIWCHFLNHSASLRQTNLIFLSILNYINISFWNLHSPKLASVLEFTFAWTVQAKLTSEGSFLVIHQPSTVSEKLPFQYLPI